MQSNHALIFKSRPKSARVTSLKISGLASAMVEHAQLQLLKDAIHETNQVIATSSSLPDHEKNADLVETARDDIRAIVYKHLSKHNKEITAELLIRFFSIAIKAQRTGNCHEFTLYCYALLAKLKINSEIFRLEGGNHVFLVLNRDHKFPADDFNMWNSNATIVDPFYHSIYMAHEIPVHLQSCVHSTLTNSVLYHPFDPLTHTLDNKVLAHMVEDWQALMKRVRNYVKL